MKVRYRQAESGTCRADLCSEIVCQAREPDPDGGIAVRAFCRDHARERDLELSVRNASGRTAEVLQLSDYERGPDGRARVRSPRAPAAGDPNVGVPEREGNDVGIVD